MTGEVSGSDLPHLVLALHQGSGPALVAQRKPDGSVSAGLEAWPSPPPASALILHWPARFPWSETGYRFQAGVRERGGALFPLAAVLGQMNLPAPRSLRGLLEVLDVGLDEFEDPAAMGSALVAAVADALAGLETPGDGLPESAPSPRYPPCPEILTLLPVVPEAPGVYTFHAADSRPLYVGKAANLRVRVGQHFSPRPGEEGKSRTLSRKAARLTWEITGSELEALLLEQDRIYLHRPGLNTQERVHSRPRGSLRGEKLLLCLPSASPEKVEVCLVSGSGSFHWEPAPARESVPRGLWQRLKDFLDGDLQGRPPGRPEERLTREEMAERAEIVLSWLARHPGRGNRIDLRDEQPTRDLARRLRKMLAENPEGERVEVR